MANVLFWSRTATDNDDADVNISLPEQMNAALLNDAGRAIMASVANFIYDTFGGVTLGGGTTAYTLAIGGSYTSGNGATLANARVCGGKMPSAPTGAMTLNVAGLGAKKAYDVSRTQIASGGLNSGEMTIWVYDSTLDSAAGGWINILRGVGNANTVLRTGALTDNALTRGDGGGGGLQASLAILGDTGNLSGLVDLVMTGHLTVGGDISGTANLDLSSTDAGASSGPLINLDRNSASPAANDDIGLWNFNGRDSGAAQHTYGSVYGKIISPTNPNERGAIVTSVSLNGTNTPVSATYGGTTVDASGIVVNAAIAPLDLSSGSNTGAWIPCSGAVAIRCASSGLNVARTADGTVATFYSGTTARGSISIAGSTTAYNTSSDKRFKEDWKDFDAGSILDGVEVWDFRWKETGERAHGVLAQDALFSYPVAVHYDEDTDSWSVDYSKYVPLLIKENQSLRRRLEDIEERLAALEAK